MDTLELTRQMREACKKVAQENNINPGQFNWDALVGFTQVRNGLIRHEFASPKNRAGMVEAIKLTVARHHGVSPDYVNNIVYGKHKAVPE